MKDLHKHKTPAMNPPIEIYVLGESRSTATVLAFLEKFMPNRRTVQDDYPFPELVDDPEVVFHDISHLLAHLEIHPTAAYAIYFSRAEAGEPVQAMVFFTDDGRAIFGLVVSPENAASTMRHLKEWSGAFYGMATEEWRPPDSAVEFVERCNRSAGIRLVEGTLHF